MGLLRPYDCQDGFGRHSPFGFDEVLRCSAPRTAAGLGIFHPGAVKLGIQEEASSWDYGKVYVVGLGGGS